MDARQWLRANGYDDIADMIDEIISEWQAAGKKPGEIGGMFWQATKMANLV